MTLIERIKEWYNGRFIPYADSPDPNTIIIGGSHNYSTSARIARWLVAHGLKHWQWWIGTTLAVFGLVIAWLAWRHPQSPVPFSYPVTPKNEARSDTLNKSELKHFMPAIPEIAEVRFVLPAQDSEMQKSQTKP